MQTRFLSSVQWGQQILKLEDWFDTPKPAKNKVTNWFLELLSSFILILMIGIPLSLSISGTSEITNPGEWMNKIYFFRVFYLAITFFLTFIFFRKWKISGSPLGLVYVWASKNIDWKEFIIRLAFQLVGGMLATYVLFQISIGTGTFVPMDLKWNSETQKWTGLGTGLGSPKPFIRGWINTDIGVKTYHGEYWFYLVRMIIEIAMIFIGMIGMFYFKRYRLRGHVLGRFILQFLIVLVSLKFQAHSANIVRFTSGITMAVVHGGYHNWQLYAFVLSGHVFALTVMFMTVRNKKVKFIN